MSYEAQRWRCKRGCNEVRAIIPVRVGELRHFYYPMISADITPTLHNPTHRRTVKGAQKSVTVVGPPMCAKCKGPLVREGLCSVCHTNQHLEFYVEPPDFDPELDDPERPNTCAGCADKIGLDEPPIETSVAKPLPHIDARTYEERIIAARGRPGLRKALLRAARRDHPDDPRWDDFDSSRRLAWMR